MRRRSTLSHQPMRETYTVWPANERKVHLFGQPMREKYTVRPANEGKALIKVQVNKKLNNVQGEQKTGGRNLTLMETKKQCLFLKDRTVKMPVLTLKTAL